MDVVNQFPTDTGRTTYMVEAPHVHLHYMQDDTLMNEDGFADLEVCCHGCGSSTVYRYSAQALLEFEESVRCGKGDPGRGHPRIRKIRDDFLKRHKECVPEDVRPTYTTACPSDRTMMQFTDLREEGL